LERWIGSHLSTGEVCIDDRTLQWLDNALWRAALQIADAWGAHREASVAKGIKPAVNEAWLARLGRWNLLTASPIGVARCSSLAGTEELRLFLG
jgi:hypothetical protein